jgi:Tfp pilus assembly protein PilO
MYFRGIDMSKPNRVRTIIMLPFVAFVFFIGWCLSWTNQKKQIHTKSHNKKYNFGNLRTSYSLQRHVVYINSRNKQINPHV